MFVKIRIYEGEGIAAHSEMDLIETRIVERLGTDMLSGQTVALLLLAECPEFRNNSGISVNKVFNDWSSTIRIRRIVNGNARYYWQDVVVSISEENQYSKPPAHIPNSKITAC